MQSITVLDKKVATDVYQANQSTEVCSFPKAVSMETGIQNLIFFRLRVK